MLNFYLFRQDYLKFEGNDRLDLINRLSTNQVNTLQKFKGIKSVLTNDKGRFVDLLTLYNFGDFIFTACSFNNSVKVLTHLEKYTIMDDFKPLNISGTHQTILFFGDNADEFIKDAFNINMGNFTNNDFEKYVKNDRHSMIARNDDPFKGYMFIYSSKDHGFWQNEILNSNLKTDYTMNEIDDVEFNIRRIEYGIPIYPNEMNDQTNPIECSLTKYVSFAKGCYIGQEVIARLDTYDKINKHLVMIESEKDFTADDSKIINDGKECGYITSSAYKTGLGFVKTIYLDFKKDYNIKQKGIQINCKLKPINQSLLK